ncbi:hypothetical protein J3E68DRAFT_274661 [Trichoderma sp. SZMC 28012]
MEQHSTAARQGARRKARRFVSFGLDGERLLLEDGSMDPPGLRDERRSNGPPSSSPCGLRCVSRDHVYERYRRQRERLFFFSTTRPARFPRSGHRRAITSYTHGWACQNHKEIWVCALLGRRCGLRPEKQAGLIHDNERAELRERNRRRKSHALYVASMALGELGTLLGQDRRPSLFSPLIRWRIWNQSQEKQLVCGQYEQSNRRNMFRAKGFLVQPP